MHNITTIFGDWSGTGRKEMQNQIGLCFLKSARYLNRAEVSTDATADRCRCASEDAWRIGNHPGWCKRGRRRIAP